MQFGCTKNIRPTNILPIEERLLMSRQVRTKGDGYLIFRVRIGNRNNDLDFQNDLKDRRLCRLIKLTEELVKRLPTMSIVD